jgi:hypothetical protein
MKLRLTKGMTFESVTKVLQEELPAYKTRLRKNPILRFSYIEVKKNGFVGVWVRLFDSEKEAWLIKAIPSAIVRGLFGGLLLFIFINGSQKKVRYQVAEVIKMRFP